MSNTHGINSSSITGSSECPVVLPQQPLVKSLSSSRFSDTESRILSQAEANSELTKYIVIVRNPKNELYCSGTIVGNNVVVTTIICAKGADYVFFVYEQNHSSRKEIKIKKSITPISTNVNEYSPLNLALLELDETIPYGYQKMKVSSSTILPNESSYVRVAGYGQFPTLNSDVKYKLQEGDIPTYSFNKCSEIYKLKYNVIFKSAYGCGGYASKSCDMNFGDSGGAVIQYDPFNHPVLVAVVISASYLKKTPNLFLRIGSYSNYFHKYYPDIDKTSVVDTIPYTMSPISSYPHPMSPSNSLNDYSTSPSPSFSGYASHITIQPSPSVTPQYLKPSYSPSETYFIPWSSQATVSYYMTLFASVSQEIVASVTASSSAYIEQESHPAISHLVTISGSVSPFYNPFPSESVSDYVVENTYPAKTDPSVPTASISPSMLPFPSESPSVYTTPFESVSLVYSVSPSVVESHTIPESPIPSGVPSISESPSMSGNTFKSESPTISPTPSTKDEGKKLSTGGIVGVVIGSISCLVILLLILFYFFYYKNVSGTVGQHPQHPQVQQAL